MCGVLESALGVDFEPVIKKFRSGMPQRFTEAKGEASLLGIVAEYDEKKSAMVSIKRIKC
jgi:calcineurin-like phosphoesterase